MKGRPSRPNCIRSIRSANYYRCPSGNGLDEAVLAFSIRSLHKFCPCCSNSTLFIPIRAVLDWGEGVKITDQRFDFVSIPMLAIAVADQLTSEGSESCGRTTRRGPFG